MSILFDEMMEEICEKNQKIADLEAKLAESEKESNARYESWQEEIRECDRLRVFLEESKEKCEELKQAISKCTGELPPNVAFDIANDDIRYQIVCNLTDRNQEHRKTIRELKQQLANKDDEITQRLVIQERDYNQDKISFALEQLEKAKESVLGIDKTEIKTLKNGFSTLYVDRPEVITKLDNQIKQLKEIE